MTAIKTKSQDVAADVAALVRARNPLIWIVTREEARVERYLFEAATAVRYAAMTWDVGQGIVGAAGQPVEGFDGSQDCGAALDMIRARALAEGGAPSRGMFIMRDLPVWFSGGLAGATTMRQVRNLARLLPGTELQSAQSLVVLSPSGEIPPELSGHATVIEWPLPDRAEIAAILDETLANLSDDMRASAAPNGQRDKAIDAAVGLTGAEAEACYAKSLVQLKRIDPAAVAAEKRRVITREKVLEYIEPLVGGLEAVGGLENLKAWLLARSAAYSPAARAYGLPAPKGAFFAGISGCGKSLLAKATATAWGVPLLRLDLGSLKSKFVGESEGNLRRAFKVIEAIGRCVVWVDEIEKSLQGATSGSSDGGVSSDALGALLSWMQDRTCEAFVIATANEIKDLPPELLRKGRFDELWFVDMPNPAERVAVLCAALKAHGRDPELILAEPDDRTEVASACDGFTGAEIAALVPDALFASFADGAREVSVDDLLDAAMSVTPLGVTAKEKIDALRKWAAGRARPASAREVIETVVMGLGGRRLDMA